MSAKITRFIRKEGFLYFVIWMSAASFPVIYESWGQFNGSGFEWDTVIRWWKGMFPLLALFLINNHILIPLFLKKDRIALYVSSSIVLLLCCFLYQHATPPPPPPPYPPGLEECLLRSQGRVCHYMAARRTLCPFLFSLNSSVLC